MIIFISVLLILIIILAISEFKVNIKYLEKTKLSSNLIFDINLGLYLLGFIKIFGINFREDGIHILFFKIPYKKIKINKNDMRSMKKYMSKDNFKDLNPKIEKMNLKLKIGVEDVMITVFFVFAISTFLSMISAKYDKRIGMRNYYYEVIPNYNSNTLSFKFSLKISIKIVNLAKTLMILNKVRKEEKVHLGYAKQDPLKI